MRALIPGILHLDGGYSQMIEKKEELGIAASKIEVYYTYITPQFFPLRCSQEAVASQDGTCQPKSYCVFLALCVVRTRVFAGRRLERGEQRERQSSVIVAKTGAHVALFFPTAGLKPYGYFVLNSTNFFLPGLCKSCTSNEEMIVGTKFRATSATSL